MTVFRGQSGSPLPEPEAVTPRSRKLRRQLAHALWRGEGKKEPFRYFWRWFSPYKSMGWR